MLITLSICWVPGLATTERLVVSNFDDHGDLFGRKRTGTRKSSRKFYQIDGCVSSIYDILPISITSRDPPEDSTSIAEAERYVRRDFFDWAGHVLCSEWGPTRAVADAANCYARYMGKMSI